MKATGITRCVDELGRIVLPIEIRRTMGIDATTPLEILVDKDTISLRKFFPGCQLCHSNERRMVTIHGKLICEACTNLIGGMEKW